jgi:uncharacterized protein YprB with RNaseH-like and TPR domain
MPSLSDKLKSLGVKVGARDLKPPRSANPNAIENVVDGRVEETPYGNAFLVDKPFPVDTVHGCRTLRIDAPLDVIAAWADEPRLTQHAPQAFAFLDTETTGLGFGTGTYAFMVGVARYEDESFHLAQFFMRDPAEEPAMLSALQAFLKPCRGLVTFNGKSFDAPLLNARYRINGSDSPLDDLVHLDLLPLARRLWRDRLASRALGSLEENILQLPRTAEDVPGWMIPEMYFEYLQSGDARPLKGIFYHNEVDVLSMAALLEHMACQLADPLHADVHALDVMAMGKLFEALGDSEQAIRLYRGGIERQLPEDAHWDTVRRLALIYKRGEEWAQAIALWEQAAGAGHVDAHVELAKYYEHKRKVYAQAIHWTQAAIRCVNGPGFSRWERRTLLPELEHRLARLHRKADNNGN